jgi:hypothetical protein
VVGKKRLAALFNKYVREMRHECFLNVGYADAGNMDEGGQVH